ncbi:MAG: FeoB-associated Cys-rich membrane protein [Clostridiales bacterium]|jgi:hypothetical protein|nr:FeoB-associated Cys-rich membrane protein [Clostridiales bacterium]
MNIPDFILLGVIIVLVVVVSIYLHKNKDKGCDYGCSNCNNCSKYYDRK